MSCIVTYQKSNGNIFIKPCKFDYGKRVGDETSMGWKVLDIHYEYNGNYYHQQDYYRMLRSNKKSVKQKLAEYVIHKANAWR